MNKIWIIFFNMIGISITMYSAPIGGFFLLMNVCFLFGWLATGGKIDNKKCVKQKWLATGGKIDNKKCVKQNNDGVKE